MDCDKTPKLEKEEIGMDMTGKEYDSKRENRRRPKERPSQTWDGRGDKTGPGGNIEGMVGLIRERKYGGLGWKGERDEDTNSNGLRTQPRTKFGNNTKGIKLDRFRKNPMGVVADHLELIGKGLEEDREPLN